MREKTNKLLKFSKKDTPPVIIINGHAAAENDKQYVRITITDNGVGFAQNQAEQIFSMFARLHPKDKFEGTGLGLALCKKIVERHKGTITAQGEPDKGAVFTITLPRHQSHNTI